MDGVRSVGQEPSGGFARTRRGVPCNWLVPSEARGGLCAACRHNGTVPDLTDPNRVRAWRELEDAKHRLFYALMRWNLPLQTRQENPDHGLIFNFLADDPASGSKVMTGPDNGGIPLAVSEC